MTAVKMAQPHAGAGARRRSMLAKVHIAAKQLGLDASTYGEVLLRVTGVESAKTLTLPQLDAVLKEFQRLGWKGTTSTRPQSQKPNVRMIYGLWTELKPLLRGDGSDQALRAFVSRQTRSRQHPEGVAAPEFLDGRQCNLVIEGLKAWLTRVKFEAARAAEDRS